MGGGEGGVSCQRRRSTYAAATRRLIEDRVGTAEDEAARVEVVPAHSADGPDEGLAHATPHATTRGSLHQRF